MSVSSEFPSMSWTPEGLAETIASAMAEYRTQVGARLRELREARDLSQEDAAHKVGVTAKTFLRWENGRAWPTPDNWQAITRYFGADPREGIPSPGPLGLGMPTGHAPNGNGNGNGNGHATLDQVLAEVQALRADTKNRYDALDVILRTILGYWQAARGEPAGLPTTVAEAQALLDWAQAQERTAPRSQGGEGRRAESG